MSSIRKGLMAVGLAILSAAVQAQASACAAGDAVCYQRQYEQACAERNVSTAESCEAWIRQTDGRDRVAHLMQGHGWMAIANHLDASPALKQQSREKGVAIFRQLAATDRSDAEALLALSTVTEDATERLQLLRQVVRLKPGGAIAVESLARELEKLGGREHLLEAAEAVERASSAQTGTPRMRLAERAIALFEAAGAPDRARELRQRIRQNVGANSRAG